MKNLIIDATGERACSREEHDTALQAVVASHLGLPLEEVQTAWITVGLVGGMEGVTLPLVREELALLVSTLREQGRPLQEMCLVVILFQEYEEGAVVAANCAFTSCVQSLAKGCAPHVIGVMQTAGKRGWVTVEGRIPHVIGVMQTTGERGWVIVGDFPSTEQESL
jgi:hypothetical protein